MLATVVLVLSCTSSIAVIFLISARRMTGKWEGLAADHCLMVARHAASVLHVLSWSMASVWNTNTSVEHL